MELPEHLKRYADAIDLVIAIPDPPTSTWYPHGYPHGRRVPIEPDHRHPSLPGQIHWDGVIPRYACVRLALTHPALHESAARLRVQGAALLGADDALYAYSFDRSQHRSRRKAFAQIVPLFESA